MRDDVILCCEGVSHWFDGTHVLNDINLEIQRGEIISIVGPSGCGKSTLLRAIVGTHPAKAGKIQVRDQEGHTQTVTQPGRDRGIVYQRYSLYPFLTVLGNVALGPILDQTTLLDRFFRYLHYRRIRRRVREEAEALLIRLGLGDAITRYPGQLSGGMQQRVAIAQALIMKPALLLLDEPFGALDEATREDLQKLLLSLAEENRQAKARGEPPEHTICIVTHELNEAIYVGDRVIGLSQGWDEPKQSPSSVGSSVLYDQPTPVFRPEDPRDFEALRHQREEIRRLVFDAPL